MNLEVRTFWEWDADGVKRGERSYVPKDTYDAIAAELAEERHQRNTCDYHILKQDRRIAALEAALHEEVAAYYAVDEDYKADYARKYRAHKTSRALLASAPETPVSTLCAICDQIKELHPNTHPWTARAAAETDCEHDWQMTFGSTPFGAATFCTKCSARHLGETTAAKIKGDASGS